MLLTKNRSEEGCGMPKWGSLGGELNVPNMPQVIDRYDLTIMVPSSNNFFSNLISPKMGAQMSDF